MKKILLLLLVSLSVTYIKAQDSFNQKFLEANTLMEESSYKLALPIWLELNLEQPDNNNINYKIGVCYMHSANEKSKSQPYLIKAAENTTNNYDPFSHSEKQAPVESYFYLAQAYHLNYQLDKAMENYTAFQGKISKKHYLFNDLEHYKQQCANAQVAVKNPVNIIVNNLGNKINTEYPEYSPILSLDESTIYFTSRRLRPDSSNYFFKDDNDGMYYEDIFMSENIDGTWTEPQPLSINTENHEATINMSLDGQTLFIYKDDNGNGNLYSSTNIDGEWTTPTLLGSDVNSDADETHAAISPDGKLLYFVSDREKGIGGQDIYFCKKLPNGDWAKAQNLGTAINTEYDEDGIFIHPDGKTLYFSSKGHTSIGGFDIFYSEFDEESQTWGTPVNLGYPVNSTDDDVFFVTSADGKRGYYSSTQDKGIGEKDIYMISLVDAEEKPLTLLTGIIRVIGEDQLPDNAQITVTDNATGNLIGIYKPRKRDGKFSIILEPNMDYHIVYAASTYTQEEDLYVPPVSSFKEINRGIELQDVVFGEQNDMITYLKGFIEYKKLLASETKISLLDENDKVLETTTSDDNGFFTFKNLKPDEYYLVRLDGVDDDFINNAKVYVVNSNGEKVMLAIKKNKNRRLFKALPIGTLDKMPLLNENDDTEIANNEETPTNNSNTSTNIKELASYQEFFNYNVKVINTNDAKFKDLIDKAKSGSKVTIEIEASASKVPTKTYKTNKHLAENRAEEAKKVILKSLKENGISETNITFKKPKTLVQGPKYNGDFENKSVYEKYQYVIIRLK